jgi:hypothetical protein
MQPSGQAIVQVPAHGHGTVLGTTVATAGTILGTTAFGITLTAHGTTAGTIPGTTDGTTHGTAHGDGLTTAHTTAGTRLIGMVDIITIIHTILAEVVVVTTPTDLQATLVL